MATADVEERLVSVLEELQSIFIAALGTTHEHLEALIDPVSRKSSRTLNYLVATASGTLLDQIFSPPYQDRVGTESFDQLNGRYQRLLAEALDLASELGLPAAGTEERRAVVARIAAARKIYFQRRASADE